MPDQDEAPSHRTPLWLASPLLLAIVGLVGTGAGAVLQGFWNTRLEREKFEFSLIEKALATSDKNEAAQNLKFLVDAGLINQFSAEKIAAIASNPKTLPDFSGTTRRLIPVRDAKAVLSHLGFYKGPINDEDDDALRKAIAGFQTAQNMVPDGLIGPMTYVKLREAWPDYFAQNKPAARTGPP